MKPGLLVTGAAGVIGAALVRRLAGDAEWAGTRLVLCGRSRPALEALRQSLGPAGAGAALEVLDLGSPEALAGFARGPLRVLGPWAGAVLVAGQSQDSLLMRLEEPDWDRLMQVNALANSKILAALSREGALVPGASALLVSSVVGLRGNSGQSSYAASKGALCDLMDFYAPGLARRGCRLNVLFPPLVESPLLAGLSPEARENLFSQRLLNDPDPAATTAEQAAFLLSRRSSYVQHQIWHGDSRLSSLPW